MALETLTGFDLRVRDNVMRQLEDDPRVSAEGIGVSAIDGAVTLTGFIDSYEGKLAAERAAKRVRGVRAVANDIQVKLRLARTDDEIAHDAARALRLRASVPEHVQAMVHEGHVTLTGRVSWIFQSEVAEEAVRGLAGVVSIVNRIDVVTSATPRDIHRRIAESLHRIATLDARHIDVAIAGSVVTLNGEVSSWAERDEAGIAAAIAPGVTKVENRLRIRRPVEPL